MPLATQVVLSAADSIGECCSAMEFVLVSLTCKLIHTDSSVVIVCTNLKDEAIAPTIAVARWQRWYDMQTVRDIRLAISHEERGVFLKTQLYTSYLWGINYKPFGTGAFSIQKKCTQYLPADTHSSVASFFVEIRGKDRYDCKATNELADME